MNHTYQCGTRPSSDLDSKLNASGVTERTGQWLRWAMVLLSVVLPAGGMLASSRRSQVAPKSVLASSLPADASEAKHTFLLRRSSPASSGSAPSGSAQSSSGPHQQDRSHSESRVDPSASTGTSSLLTFQGGGAPTSDGDYVSSSQGLNTFYRFFIEVPPGLS